MATEMIEPKNLKIHPLNAEIYEDRNDPLFEESIEKHGILEPLVVNSDNMILSGVRRWKAAMKFGLEKIPCRVENPEDEVLAIIEHNRYRQKTPRELYNEYRIIKGREVQKAEERMLAGKHLDDLGQHVAQGRVKEIAANQLGVSHEHLRRINYIYSRQEDAPIKPVLEKLDKGEISVRQAYEEVMKIENPPPPSTVEKTKTFKCRACQEEYADPVTPITVVLCPECEMQFQMWLADRR